MQLLQQMVHTAERACGAISAHMAHEEAEVLAGLELSLPPAEQCTMVWHMLCAMPLRLLERVMPWVFGESTIPLAHVVDNVASCHHVNNRQCSTVVWQFCLNLFMCSCLSHALMSVRQSKHSSAWINHTAVQPYHSLRRSCA